MVDETVEDECSVGEERLKIDIWYASLDAVICQMKERFGDNQLQLLDCIAKFSPKHIMSTQNKGCKVKSEDIAYLCDIYCYNLFRLSNLIRGRYGVGLS